MRLAFCWVVRVCVERGGGGVLPAVLNSTKKDAMVLQFLTLFILEIQITVPNSKLIEIFLWAPQLLQKRYIVCGSHFK